MPLFPGSSVPASMRKSFDPGVHINTTPVLRPAHTSWKVLPGSMSTVATRAPSLNAATLLAASFSGSSTHPVHVADGVALRASTSKTSMDSRPPWFVAYSVYRPVCAGRRLKPCSTTCFGSGGPGQPANLVLSARAVDTLELNRLRAVFACVSIRCSPLPAVMPLAISQRAPGTSTRSSAACNPQMKLNPPDGAHAADCAAIVLDDAPIAMAVNRAATIIRFISLLQRSIAPAT